MTSPTAHRAVPAFLADGPPRGSAPEESRRKGRNAGSAPCVEGRSA